MAISIQVMAEKLIKVMEVKRIALPNEQKTELVETGFFTFAGLNFSIPNAQGPIRFGVNVNKSWFRNNFTDKSKPHIRRNRRVRTIDCNLFPVGDKIFALHYLKLREYTLQLENGRDKWFDTSRWGMIIDPVKGNFHWVENNKQFPLNLIHSIEDLALLPEDFHKSKNDYRKHLVAPPNRTTTESRVVERRSHFQLRNVDFLELAKINAQLGREGEEFVVKWEKERLQSLGHPEFAKKIEWVSQTRGDGTGYDILSFEETGDQRFIEVKTTTQGIDSPFLITQNELEFSKLYSRNYYLYRVFSFGEFPYLFVLKGNLEEYCDLVPKLFEARF